MSITLRADPPGVRLSPSLIAWLSVSLLMHALLMLLTFAPMAVGQAAPTAIEVRLAGRSDDDSGKPPADFDGQPATPKPVLSTERSRSSASPAGTDAPTTDRSAAPVRRPGSLAAMPIYYAVADLTRRPQVIENIDYSSLEQLTPGASGRAILTLFINASGTIDRVAIDESDFDRATQGRISKEFGRMRFSPASKGAVIVASRLRIELVRRNSP